MTPKETELVRLTQRDRSLLLEEYEAGTKLYIYEDELRWSRFTTFSVTEGTLLVAYFQPYVVGHEPIALAIALVGLSFAFLMLSVMVRSQAHFDYRDERMKKIERALRQQSRMKVMTMYSLRHPRTNKMLTGWKRVGLLRANKWIPFFCIALTVTWLFLLVLLMGPHLIALTAETIPVPTTTTTS